MLDSINIGMGALLGYSRGLRVIADNTSNLSTPGFKSSSLVFSNVGTDPRNSAVGWASARPLGQGVVTSSTTLNFKPGDIRQTGNNLDLAVDGAGLFTLKDEAGNLHYTRAGQFQFDSHGALVNRSDGAKVMARDADGAMAEMSIAGARSKLGSATTSIAFNGNLSSDQPDYTITPVKALDALGAEHTLSVKFTNLHLTPPPAPAPVPPDGYWQCDLMEGATVIGTAQVVFVSGRPDAASGQPTITYSPPGVAPLDLTLDFSKDVTSVPAGALSTLKYVSHNGVPPGDLSDVSFDTSGTMLLTYSSGETVKGFQLLLARFDTLAAVAARGDNQFDAIQGSAWRHGVAGSDGFGSVKGGSIEISNVDLAQQFSDIVIMQRGYQAASQVISTANEMLQQLFSMRGK